MYRDNPALYEIAKKVTIEAGFDYHHPVTGVVTKGLKQPKPKAKAKPKPKKR